ncbi:MAG: FAD binding domain-containing protein, partial [Bdellovibrionales bacterium]|nr:FAD binding domain-containing protein [Bdellovibrionales bacterium]
MRKQASFYINGQMTHASADECQMMLADFLRYKKSLTGTKVVCAEGDCGACTLLKRSPLSDATYTPINSCIASVAQMDGSSLITVEGLTRDTGPHPAQDAMMKCHGSQCGFCTPGFVMAIAGDIEEKIKNNKDAAVNLQQAKNALTGNLCRCTGYQPIIDAFLSIDLKKITPLDKTYYSKTIDANLKKICKSPLTVTNDQFSFYAPTNLKDAKQYLKKYKHIKIIAGTTDLGVLHNKQKQRIQHAMSLHLISDLYKIKKTASVISVGAQVNLSTLRKYILKSIPQFASFLDIFASPQIKNMATLVGNIANASPIADTPPFLLVANAKIEVIGAKGKRLIPIEDFYISYKKTKLAKDEIITHVHFEIPNKKDLLGIYKVSQRKDLDISAVNLAIRA